MGHPSGILSAGPAPDGKNWMVMAHFFASHRWGDGEGIFNYGREAQDLLRMMIHKDDDPERGGIVSMFHPEEKQIRFTPDGQYGPNFTDPSYHTPHFTELMARWAEDPADRAFLGEVARTSRQLFRNADRPMGPLLRRRRVAHLGLAGNGLTGIAATAALAADPELGKPMVERLWNLELPNDVGRDTDGLMAEEELRSHRYYSGLLMMFGLLHASGTFQVYGPVSP